MVGEISHMPIKFCGVVTVRHVTLRRKHRFVVVVDDDPRQARRLPWHKTYGTCQRRATIVGYKACHRFLHLLRRPLRREEFLGTH
jgi:hypothetical protein